MPNFLKVEVNNNLEEALRQLKIKSQKEGLFKIVKKKRYYEKPSQIKFKKSKEKAQVIKSAKYKLKCSL